MSGGELGLNEVREIFREQIVGRWIPESRYGNDGSAGNTLEDLLGISENNLKIPDWGTYELKVHKREGSSLLTLLHREPLPRSSVPKLLKSLGWRHQHAGGKYDADEMSFRSTTRASDPSVRGFQVDLIVPQNRIEFNYRPESVEREAKDGTGVYDTYGDWADDVERRTLHYSEVLPVYWNLDWLTEEMRLKLDNTILALYDQRGRRDVGREFLYTDVFVMSGFRSDRLESLFREHALLVDFDARSRHNHGTKLRIDIRHLDRLFEKFVVLV